MHKSLLGGEAFLQCLGDAGTRNLGVGTAVPLDANGVEGRLGMPPGVGDNSDCRIPDADNFFHARHRLGFAGIKTLQLAAENRAVLDRGIEHAGQLEVGAVNLLAGEFVHRVETLDAFADELPVLRVLERNILRCLKLGGRLCDLAKGDAAIARRVRDDAVGCNALGGRDFPFIGRRLHQHHARRRAALAHVIVRSADAAAAAGAKVTPDALARDVGARRRIFGGDLGPVAFEFLGNHLRQAGERALAHFRAGDTHHHGIVRPDHNPGVDLRRAIRGTYHTGTKGNIEPEHHAAANGSTADHEGATGYVQAGSLESICHGLLLRP